MDAAILDRCDESLYFPCPDRSCRLMLLDLYFQKFVKNIIDQHNIKEFRWSTTQIIKRLFFSDHSSFLKMKVDDGVMTGEQLEDAADATAGFSGREISKLMVAMQSALHACSNSGILTQKDAWDILLTKVQEHKEKKRMISGPDDMSAALSPSDHEVSNPLLSLTALQQEDDLTEVINYDPPELSELTKKEVSTKCEEVNEENNANSKIHEASGNSDSLMPLTTQQMDFDSAEIAHHDPLAISVVRENDTSNADEDQENTTISGSKRLICVASPRDANCSDPLLLTTPQEEDDKTECIHRKPPQIGTLRKDNERSNIGVSPAAPRKQKKRFSGNRRRKMGILC